MGHGGDLVAGSSPAGVPVLEVVPSVLFGLLSPGVLIALVVGVLVLTAALVGVGWSARRRLRRSARVRVGLLRLRADVLPAGPRREVATLRVDLRGHLDQTDRVLHVQTVPGPGPLKDLQSRLRAAAEDLDIQLRLLGDEPDDASMVSGLRALRDEVTGLEAGIGELHGLKPT